MLQLFGAVVSRALRPLWALEEVQASYELVPMSFSKLEHKDPEFLKLNPLGRIPVLKHGDLVLLESAAQCNYIASLYPQANLLPATLKERALCDQWMFFAVADLEQPLSNIMKHTRVILPVEMRLSQMVEVSQFEFKKLLPLVDAALSHGNEYLLGVDFSCADILVGHSLMWAMKMGLGLDSECLGEYVQRLRKREAFKRVFSKYSLS